MGESESLEHLSRWYGDLAKPVLAALAPERVTEFDGALARLERMRHVTRREFTICLLGNSGVGKSTLLNATVAGPEVIVPAGGIGPLTALALFGTHVEGHFRARDMTCFSKQVYESDIEPPHENAIWRIDTRGLVGTIKAADMSRRGRQRWGCPRTKCRPLVRIRHRYGIQ